MWPFTKTANQTEHFYTLGHAAIRQSRQPIRPLLCIWEMSPFTKAINQPGHFYTLRSCGQSLGPPTGPNTVAQALAPPSVPTSVHHACCPCEGGRGLALGLVRRAKRTIEGESGANTPSCLRVHGCPKVPVHNHTDS